MAPIKTSMKTTPQTQTQSPLESACPTQLPEKLFTRDLHNLHLHHTQTDNISGRAEKYHYEIWITSPHSIAFRVNTNNTNNTTTTAAVSRPKLHPRRPSYHSRRSNSYTKTRANAGATGSIAFGNGNAKANGVSRTNNNGSNLKGLTLASSPQLKFRTRPADYKCLRAGQLWRVSWQAEQMGRYYSMVVDVVAGEVLAFVGL